MSSPPPRACLHHLANYVPGRATAMRERDDLHRLSSNESPFGASPLAQHAYGTACRHLHLYPDSRATELREALGASHGVDPDRCICTAGIDELIGCVARAYLEPGQEAICTQHAFSMYPIYAKAAGATLHVVPERDYTADVDAILARVNERTRIVFLANPNNPTGTYLPAADIRRLHAGLPETCLFFLDEAYGDFVDVDTPCGLELARRFENVLTSFTFSKAYGLAGLRVAWATGAPAILDTIYRVRSIFPISVAAQATSIAALNDTAHVKAYVDYLRQERPRVTHALRHLGLNVPSSQGNFVLVNFPPGRGDTIDRALTQHGYILRGLKPYGLDDSLRFTLGTRDENDAVLALIRQTLQACAA